MAYQWCSAISENIGRLERNETPSESPSRLRYGGVESRPLRRGDHPSPYITLLFMAFAVGFRQVDPNYISTDIYLVHTRHHESMLDHVFKSEDDDAIADVVSAWVVDPLVSPSGSCARRLIELAERGRPFSPRLRQVIVYAIRGRWPIELKVAGLELVLLLNHLEVSVEDVDDIASKLYWVTLLVGVLRSPVGRESLSSHYWISLGNLISTGARVPTGSPGLDMETMRSLEETEDWEKLEIWLLVVWGSRYTDGAVPMEDVERTTLKLFLQRPIAIQRFKDLYEKETPATYAHLFRLHGDQFRRIRDRARAERLRSESPL